MALARERFRAGLRLGLADLYALDTTAPNDIDVLNHLILHDVAGQIADYLARLRASTFFSQSYPLKRVPNGCVSAVGNVWL